MEKIVWDTIYEHKLVQKGDHILVAVSGGPDSIALLHWLKEHCSSLDIILSCAHFNHGFRGEESDEEADFVAETCRQWGIPFYQTKMDLLKKVQEGGVNLQALSREYRYKFLQETAQKIGANRIALAHHKDDQVETILMRFLRGTGTTGLMGMPYERTLIDGVTLIRPFLNVTKAHIQQYLKLHQLSYRIDSSNLKTDYMRNRIRLQLLPELTRYNSNLSSSIVALAHMIEEDERYLSQLAYEKFMQVTNVTMQPEGELCLKLPEFNALPLSLQRRIIKLICNYLHKSDEEVPYHHITALRSLFSQEQPHQWDLPWNIRVYIRYGEALFRKNAMDFIHTPYHFSFTAPATIQLPDNKGQFQCFITTKMEMREGTNTVYFDYDKIHPHLTLRTRQKGDRIELDGLGRHKKVKDIFIDKKVPREDRDLIPLLFAGEDLLWIVGIKKSAKGRYDHTTKRFLCCRYFFNI